MRANFCTNMQPAVPDAMKTRALLAVIALGAVGLIWYARAESTKVSTRTGEGPPASPSGSPAAGQPSAGQESGSAASNDLPPGHFAMKLTACGQSGVCTPFNAEFSGTGTLERFYVPNEGWVDFKYCELDEHFSGGCQDDKSRPWQLNGPG